MTIRLATTARNASTDGVVDLIDAGPSAGTVDVRTGSQPASAQDAATGTLLATITLSDPAFGASSTGVATAGDPASVNSVASGTAGWFRVKDSTGATVFDGSVSAAGGGGDMIVANTNIASGQPVDVTSFTYTTPA